MSKQFTINVTSRMQSGQVYFNTTISPTPNIAEVAMLPTINLSRAGNKLFRIDQLSAHNGNGATWNTSVGGDHGTIAQHSYTSRVQKDLAAAWTLFQSRVAAAEQAAMKSTYNTQPSVQGNSGDMTFFAANGK